MNRNVLSMMLLAVVALAPAASAEMTVLPEYEIMDFCNREAGETEGMWRWECRSMEDDCRKALLTLPQGRVDECVLQRGNRKSYCALLICAAPDGEVAQMARNVISSLAETR